MSKNTWGYIYGDECDELWEHFDLANRDKNDRMKVKFIEYQTEEEISNDTGHKEIISSFKPVAKALQDYVQHELDIITESEWFDNLVENKVKQQLRKSKQ